MSSFNYEFDFYTWDKDIKCAEYISNNMTQAQIKAAIKYAIENNDFSNYPDSDSHASVNTEDLNENHDYSDTYNRSDLINIDAYKNSDTYKNSEFYKNDKNIKPNKTTENKIKSNKFFNSFKFCFSFSKK